MKNGATESESRNDVEIVLIAFSILVTSIFSISICLYCWFPKLRRKKKKFGATEHTQISTNDPDKTLGNGSIENGTNSNPFSKFTTLFTTSSAFSSPGRPYQSQASVDSQFAVQDKPPMTLKTETVQPSLRTHSTGSATSQKAQLARKPSGLLKLIGNEIFQDETKPPDGEYLGKLEFAVSYDFQVMTLTVRVIKAVDLPAMDLNGTSDPFVKCCLLPDRKRKLETNIRRKTCNPTWGETFLFEGLPYDKVQQRVLYLQVMDHDRFSRNDPIGEVYLPLHTMDLTDDVPRWEFLSPCKGSNKRGALLLSLQYEPLLGIIEVVIHKAIDLKPMDLNGTSDPYVKLWLLYRGKKTDKKKTAVFKNNLNPSFDQKFEFSCPMERLRETQLEISVMDKDLIGRNEIIGKIYLGYKSQSLEKQHWKDMLNNVRTPVKQWHVLKV